MPAPFDQRGKAHLAPVGREVIFGFGTYLDIRLTQTSRTLPMEVHLGAALGQQGAES